jgi:hypothetical protein
MEAAIGGRKVGVMLFNSAKTALSRGPSMVVPRPVKSDRSAYRTMRTARIDTVFALSTADISAARRMVEDILKLSLTERESFYQGGVYYVFESAELSVIVRNNIDLLDNVPAEECDAPVLLKISDRRNKSDVTRLLQDGYPNLTKIREKRVGGE